MSFSKDETFIAHLKALRLMLIKCLSALGICLLPCFFAAPYVIDLLIFLIKGTSDLVLNFFAPMEVFILQIKVAFVLDVLVCFPYIAAKVWDFLVPALYENEQKFIKSIVFSSSALFIIGVAFCLLLILPLIIRFGLSFASADLKPLFGISNLISLCLWLSIVFGLMFQFPLVTYALIRSGIVSYQSVKSKRAYVFLGILIISGILTPPDIISQLMLTLPTYGLFETGLLFARKGFLFQRKN